MDRLRERFTVLQEVAEKWPGRLFTKNTGLCKGEQPPYTDRRVLNARKSRERVIRRKAEKLTT